jgi:PKD repeat protein
MLWGSAIRAWLGKGKVRASSRPRQARRQLHLECLEDRWLFSIGLGGGGVGIGGGGGTDGGLVVSAGPDQTINEATSMTFSGSATGGVAPYTYVWTFGDGSSLSGTPTPTHEYVSFGIYTATLSVTDSAATTKQSSAIISVLNVPPTVNAGGPYSGIPGVAINFVGSATDPSPTDSFIYAWKFGDGTTSTLQNPSHAYATSGSYSVTLTVTDSGGAAVSATTSAVIAPGSAPTAKVGSYPNVNPGVAVKFSGQASGEPPLFYAWSFGDGGSSTGTLTPTHAYSKPGTYTVTLTVTDFYNRTASSSTTLIVNSSALNAHAGGPYLSAPGASIPFNGSADDPSPTPTFKFNWNFGDGATSTLQNPTHRYAAYGLYTVTLTVTDQTGASASTTTTAFCGASIVTPFDTIPDFGARPTIVSVASGNWSNPQTWSLGRLPTTGDIVDIKAGTTVTYDVMSAVSLNTVEVLAGGQLHWRPDINTEIVVGNFVVMPGGDLEVGTVAAPIAANVMANIVIANQAINSAMDPSQFGTGLIGLGTVHMAGAAKTPFVLLAAELHAGSTTLSLSQVPTGWQVGDQLFLPDTQQYYTNPGNGYVPQWEMATIAKISGTTITLTSPLLYNHLGAHDTDGTLRFLPNVVDLSRNVMISSQDPKGTRGYVMFTGRADVDIRYIGFCELGRTTVNALDSITYAPSGQPNHVGKNQVDRYPMYFRHLDGPAQIPADGYQFTAIGNEIDNGGSAAPLQKWGLVLHDSNYGLISGNVVQNVGGAGFVTQDGSESYNVFDGNFAAVISAPGKSDETDLAVGGNPGRDGAGFWFRGHNNYVRNNVAVDSAMGFQYMSYRRGMIPVPLFQGADSSNPAQMQTLNLGTLPILQFQGDEAYGAMGRGLDIWEIGSFGEVLFAVPDSVIKNFSAWNFYSVGISIYRTHCLTFDGIVLRGDLNQDNHSTGFNLTSPYRLRDHTITNSDIQGLGTGVLIDMPMVGGMQTGSIYRVDLPQTATGDITISNSVIKCYTGVQVNSVLWAGSLSAPRLTTIQNVRFSSVKYAITGKSQEFIAMHYVTLGLGDGGRDMIEPDQVQVVNFNGVVGDNFRVYYMQQAAGFVMPVNNLIQGLRGAPTSGMTNQVCWNLYHTAIAGAVSPSTKTRAGVLGYVQ